MLEISQAQLDALEAPVAWRAAEVIEAWLRATYPQAVHGQGDALKPRVLEGVRTARTFGLVRMIDVRQFVALQFLIGPNFHRHPALAALLSDPETAIDRRMDVLFAFAKTADWDAARALG